MIRIVEPGWATTVQDHGRIGLAHLGVPRAGAVDRPAHDLVNRLVGNAVQDATIETAGGLVIEAAGPLIVATSDGTRHTLRPGTRLRVDPQPDRVWAYLAVRGGLDVSVVLGARSHDTLAGIGPAPIVAGAVLPVGPDPQTELTTDYAPTRALAEAVRVTPGPEADWFEGGTEQITARSWRVSGHVSRVGVRFESGSWTRTPAAHDQLASFGLVEGAVQVTPRGEAIVMLANHPTTGGYPVIAVVDAGDLAAVAQTRPGSSLRFVASSIA